MRMGVYGCGQPLGVSRTSVPEPRFLEGGGRIGWMPTDSTTPGYSSDRPLIERSADGLQRRNFAERIGKTLVRRSSPESVVVGLYGPWGSGKTTVLNFISEYLDDEYKDEVVVVNYNPWVYRSDEEMLASFFELVAKNLEASLESGGQRAGELLGRFGGLLRLVPVVGAGAAEVAQAASTLLTNRELEDLKSDFGRVLADAGVRILVLVDDIDRLTLNQVLSIFRLVKLVADFDYTSYILAFDRDVVSTALERNLGGDLPVGPRYLEKIIQVPLHLPEPDRQVMRDQFLAELNRLLRDHELLASLDDDGRDRLAMSFDHMSVLLDSPRLAKRAINALEFSLPFLHGEVNVADLTILEVLRVSKPGLYEGLREVRHELVRGSIGDEANTDKLESLATLTSPASAGLLALLFPNWGEAGIPTGAATASVDSFSATKRICSGDYVDRYFIYGLQSGSVSDVEVFRFVTAPTDQDSQAWLVKALEHSTYDLTFKLRQHSGEIDSERSSQIAELILRNAAVIPDALDVAGVSTLIDRVAMLLVDLCRGEDLNEAVERVSELLGRCSDPNLRLAIVRWSNVSDTPSILSEELQNSLVAGFAKELTTDQSLDELNDRSFPLFVKFLGRSCGHEILRPLMSRWLSNPDNANRVVTACLAYSGTMMIRTGYDLLAQFVDPEVVGKVLVAGRHDEALQLLDKNRTFHPPFLE